MRINEELIGKEVINSDATILGKIKDVEIDFDNIQNIKVLSLIVSKGGIQKSLNIKKTELVVPFNLVEVVGDKVILVNAFESDCSSMDDNDDDLDLDKFEEEINDLKANL